MTEGDRVWVDFTQDEALVLLEWLSALIEGNELPTPEFQVVGGLEAMLERQVDVVTSPKYEQELADARMRLRAIREPDGDDVAP
ncbi:hypothetical protein CLV46_2520 [Diaminobutyricimonas aerilata]|uniref:Uncharacterized protein n=1 Tax=Diaminobutyricimonas aerilata TaxID=1162967 RepID=A0A2M9CM11_9MICO|nr:hypothetical protein [Diaminobutyricimonas aerilata]PJJ72941.1 hypothetical protein CLV46_2520 [Diaminobutyricimonas aerilata]